MEQVKVYAKPEFDWEQMEQIKNLLIKNKDKTIDELYKEIKDKPDKTESENLFIDAYELKVKEEVTDKIKEDIRQLLPEKPKIKMKL
jgi:cell division protein FtsX